MTSYIDTYEIKIEPDEDGFHLLIRAMTEDGDHEDLDIPLGMLAAEALYDHVKAAIGPWLRERDQANNEWADRLPGESASEATERLQGAAERLAYNTSDPKHPAFHSTHADIWDAREGK